MVHGRMRPAKATPLLGVQLFWINSALPSKNKREVSSVFDTFAIYLHGRLILTIIRRQQRFCALRELLKRWLAVSHSAYVRKQRTQLLGARSWLYRHKQASKQVRSVSTRKEKRTNLRLTNHRSQRLNTHWNHESAVLDDNPKIHTVTVIQISDFKSMVQNSPRSAQISE